MKRLLIILLLLSAGLNAGLLYKQWRAPHDPGFRPTAGQEPEHRFRRFGRSLDLSDAQQSELGRIRREMEPVMRRYHRRMDALRDELQAALLDEDLDMKRVRELTASMSMSRSSLDSLITERLVRELPSLSPEQRLRYLKRSRAGGRGRNR